jgi:hypothetical protein
MVESAVAPDSIMNQYETFLMFFHFTNRPIIYPNDDSSKIEFDEMNKYDVEYTMGLATDIVKDSTKKID